MSSDWVALKEKGNEEFKKKNYQTAISIYTDAISKNSLTRYRFQPRITLF